MNNQTDLLPCPFCGSQPKLQYIGNEWSKKRSIIIKCPECRITRTDSTIRFCFDWLEEVVKKGWNTRKEIEVVQ